MRDLFLGQLVERLVLDGALAYYFRQSLEILNNIRLAFGCSSRVTAGAVGLPYATWLPYPMSKSPDDPWTGISGPVFIPTVEGGQLILDFLVGLRRRPLAAYLNGYASG